MFRNKNFLLPFNEFPIEDVYDIAPQGYHDKNIPNYRSQYNNEPGIREPCTGNKPKFLPHDFRSKLPVNHFPRIAPSDMFNNINNNHFQSPNEFPGPLYAEHNPYHDKFLPDYFTATEPLSPTEININKPPPCDIRLNYPVILPPITTYNNHAPARFIVGATNQSHK